MLIFQVAEAPPGTQAAGLDWIKAYRCSPILPNHKCYIATYWRGLIWPNHCTPFGLTTAGNIQGEVADAFRDILVWHKIPKVFKWVDDFDVLRYPIRSVTNDDGSTKFHYAFDLSTIFRISDPLGILWHPVGEKGHDFASETTYVGFRWDLEAKMVSLPETKRLKYLKKVTDFLQCALVNATVKYDLTASLHGTLQHVCFVYRDHRALMPSLSRFLSKFPNKFVSHHVPTPVVNDLKLWFNALSITSYRRSLRPRMVQDVDAWIDASTSWGIGIVVGRKWAAWKLKDGWNSDGRDIGWAETIAIELFAMWLSTTDLSDCEAPVHGDNTGSIEAHKKGRSRNVHRNSSILRLSNHLMALNISLSPVYVTSEDNRADPISRGNLGLNDNRLDIKFELPIELRDYLTYV